MFIPGQKSSQETYDENLQDYNTTQLLQPYEPHGMSLTPLQSSTLMKYYKVETQVQELKWYINCNKLYFWFTALNHVLTFFLHV